MNYIDNVFIYSLTLLVILGIIGLYVYIELLVKNYNNKKEKRILNPINYYFKKEFMTQSEFKFYYKIQMLEEHFKIIPQINLGTIINKIEKGKKRTFRNELNRNIDFAIFTKDYSKLLLLIELNDSTHNLEERRQRDLKVREICNKAGIKLITFYTNKPNEKEYVINRIITEIENIYNKRL